MRWYGRRSETSTDLTFNAVGKNTPPADVQNLQMEPVDAKNVRLKWDQAVDPDVLHGGRVYVRHSSVTDGTGTFNNAIDLVEALPGNSTEQIVPSLEGEYILRFQDDQGNFSTGSASVLVDLPDILDTQIILDSASRQDLLSPAFGGPKLNTILSGSNLKISESSTGGIGLSEGFYDFKDVVDLERVYSLDLKRFIRSVGVQVQLPFLNSQNGGIKANNTSNAMQGGLIPPFTVLVKSTVAHNLSVGDPVQIVGNTTPILNGFFTVTTVVDANDFHLGITAANNFQFSNLQQTTGVYKKVTFLDQLIPAGSFWDDYATDGNFDGTSADTVNCKMFVASTNVDPSVASAIAFTNGTAFNYTQSGTVITATATGHGLAVGDNINTILYTGNNLNAFYTVQTIPDADTFTLTSLLDQTTTGGGNFLKFTKFTSLSNGTFKGRGFAFRLQLTTGKPLVENINIQQAGVVASFSSRTENSYLTGNANDPVSMAAQQSGTSQKTVTFARPFFTGTSSLGGVNAFKPNVGVTVQNLGSGETVQILNVSGTSFDIVIRNAANNGNSNRTFTFTAVGYGKGV